MGYESKLIVVDKTSNIDYNGLRWGEVICIFNMCKMGYDTKFSKLVHASPDTDCYIYADDGNTMITIDAYGDPLTEIDISKMISVLEKAPKDYRRIDPALSMLKGFEQEKYRDLKVLHYGY